jgi:NADP-dependent 3-hydroxy acid dehydrogenase YdfG
MSAGLEGKCVVVTGVTSGIGAALVDRLIASGARVLGVARDPAKLEIAAARLGPGFTPVVADLASAEARRGALAVLLEQAPRVDIFVSNAGECVYETPLGFPVDRFRELLEVNLLAAIDLTQGLAPRMEAGAHIVAISSITARFLPNARFGPYALTKAALDRFVEALRVEVDPRGIKVTSIAPGLVDTPIYDKVEGFAQTRAKLAEQVPSWLSPGDIADAVMWAIDRPPHVVISEIAILPRGQAR